MPSQSLADYKRQFFGGGSDAELAFFASAAAAGMTAGQALTASGRLLATASRTSIFTTTSATPVDVPSLAIVVPVTNKPIRLKFHAMVLTNTALYNVTTNLVEGATVLDICENWFSAANLVNPNELEVVLSGATQPTPGNHTYKVQVCCAFGSGTQNANIKGSVNGYTPTLSAYEC